MLYTALKLKPILERSERNEFDVDLTLSLGINGMQSTVNVPICSAPPPSSRRSTSFADFSCSKTHETPMEEIARLRRVGY